MLHRRSIAAATSTSPSSASRALSDGADCNSDSLPCCTGSSCQVVGSLFPTNASHARLRVQSCADMECCSTITTSVTATTSAAPLACLSDGASCSFGGIPCCAGLACQVVSTFPPSNNECRTRRTNPMNVVKEVEYIRASHWQEMAASRLLAVLRKDTMRASDPLRSRAFLAGATHAGASGAWSAAHLARPARASRRPLRPRARRLRRSGAGEPLRPLRATTAG